MQSGVMGERGLKAERPGRQRRGYRAVTMSLTFERMNPFALPPGINVHGNGAYRHINYESVPRPDPGGRLIRELKYPVVPLHVLSQ